MFSPFVILLILYFFLDINPLPVPNPTTERLLVQRNYYWYMKGKTERLQNGSTPFGFDHLPPQKVLCAILYATVSCEDVLEALKHYKEYVHTDEFT